MDQPFPHANITARPPPSPVRRTCERDEELHVARVGPAAREGEVAALDLHVLAWVVLDGPLLAPVLAQRLVGRDAELRQETRDDAEERHVRKVARLHKLEEAIGTQGRPLPLDFNDERPPLRGRGVALDEGSAACV